jgi:ABC-type nitrate/sulfonate/bicarbonate transport system permease component
VVPHCCVAGGGVISEVEGAGAPSIAQERDADDANAAEVLSAPSRMRRKTWIVRLVSMAIVLVVWEIVGRRVNPLFMSYPSAIVRAGIALAASGELAGAMASSLKTLVAGFVAAGVIGIALGLMIGRYRAVDAATDWLVNALYATPLIAVIPLVVLWLGLGDSAKLFVVTMLAVFPVLINTAAGVRNVPRSLIDVGAAFAANERQIFVKIILPAVVPFIMTGLRLGIGRAIIGMVAAEFFTAISGLGGLIVKYGNQYDTASMFVPILILMFMGVVLTAIVRKIEDMFAPWRAHDE